MEYAGPKDSQQYLIMVDAFTEWVDVVPTRLTASVWTANELKKKFLHLVILVTSLYQTKEASLYLTRFKILLENCGTTQNNHSSQSSQFKWASREVCSRCHEVS